MSLKNVEAAIYDGKKKLYQDFGEMLFTHYGVSGPLILSGSSHIAKKAGEKKLKLCHRSQTSIDGRAARPTCA